MLPESFVDASAFLPLWSLKACVDISIGFVYFCFPHSLSKTQKKFFVEKWKSFISNHLILKASYSQLQEHSNQSRC